MIERAANSPSQTQVRQIECGTTAPREQTTTEAGPNRGSENERQVQCSKGRVEPVPFSEQPHGPWQILFLGMNESDEDLPIVPLGAFVGQIVPSAPTAPPNDATTAPPAPPGAQAPVTFRIY